MPTYRNDKTSGDMLIEGVDGEPIRLAPGETGESYIFYDRVDLTKTLDAPLWTPYVAGPKTVTAAGAGTETQAITAGTHTIRIESVTVEVEVWLHSKTVAAHKILGALQPGDCPIDIMAAGRVGTLVFEFPSAGSAVISELRKES